RPFARRSVATVVQPLLDEAAHIFSLGAAAVLSDLGHLSPDGVLARTRRDQVEDALDLAITSAGTELCCWIVCHQSPLSSIRGALSCGTNTSEGDGRRQIKAALSFADLGPSAS